jgi:hypothetical protein
VCYVVKGTLDVQEDPQGILPIEDGFFNFSNNFTKSYFAGVIAPKSMLIFMHRVCYQTGVICFPQNQFFQSFE